MRFRLFSIFTALVLCLPISGAEISLPANPKLLFRTDDAHSQLGWYRLKPGEFPPFHSEHRVYGELVEADFIHRCGQYRSDDTGELVNFTLMPYSLVYHLNAEADLRDIPLGSHLQFFLYQNEAGDFTKAAVIQDDFTRLAREVHVNPVERVNPTPEKNSPTEQQRNKHTAFLKQRGLPALIERVEGRKLIVTFLGDPEGLQALFRDEKINPEQWAGQHRQVKVAVANDELRTYNPPVDNKSATVLQCRHVATEGYGCSGMQWTIEPSLLLEGFRKGHIVRIFANGAWPVEDMPFGETLYTERPGAKTEEESSNQYSYRTDFGNTQLPWYALKPGEFPPYQSHHLVSGELRSVDPIHRSGQFRTDQSGTLVNFSMPPFGSILSLDAEAELQDLPLGNRYSFFLYQDEKGSFTKAVVIKDEFTRLTGELLTCRLEAARLDKGFLVLANQLAPLKDEKDHLVRPPDLSHAMFGVDSATRVWKGDRQIAWADLAVGDELLVNLTGCTATRRSRCTDIWSGVDTHKLTTEKRRAAHNAFVKQHGLPAWIQGVEGKSITVSIFAGNRKAFQDILNGDPNGQNVYAQRVDDDLHPLGNQMETLKFKNHPPEKNTAGTYGSAGVQWILEADQVPERIQQGTLVRIFKPEWLAPQKH